MLRTEVQRSYSAPGKVFLIGEYAVLAGLPAVVAAVGPRFHLLMPARTGQAARFAAASPAGRLREWARARGVETEVEWQDPFAGEGGFGASSAQFALLHLALSEAGHWPTPGWTRGLELYRELTAGEGQLPPSGADLVAQWRGGVTVYQPADGKGGAPGARELAPGLDWSGLLVFSATRQAGRKVATHEHLGTLAEKGFPAAHRDLLARLERPLRDALAAAAAADPRGFGRCLSDYAEALWSADLEAPAARADRIAISALPGVFGAKGCGALLSDALAVFVDPRANVDAVIALAERRGLRLVSQGLPVEPGVFACHR